MGTGKIIIGIILVLVGLWALMPLDWNGLGFWSELLFVLEGVIPILLIFLGAILVWIEWEEMRIEKPSRKRK